MTPFEYVLAFASILVGLAMADLAASLHRLLRARGRVRWDWLAPAAAVLVVLTVLEFWWAFYHLGRADAWASYGQFLPLVALLFVMFLLASAALPDEVPESGVDLADYYRTNARYFWLLFALFVGLAGVVTSLAADATVPVRVVLRAEAGNGVFAAVLVSLAIIRQRGYHTAVIVLLVVILGLSWSRLRLA